MKLTERQIKRYSKNETLEQKLQEVKSFNATQKRVIDNMKNISDKEASDFLYKNRFGNIKGIKTKEDAKYYLSYKEVQNA
jgi:hypothetical protein